MTSLKKLYFTIGNDYYAGLEDNPTNSQLHKKDNYIRENRYNGNHNINLIIFDFCIYLYFQDIVFHYL